MNAGWIKQALRMVKKENELLQEIKTAAAVVSKAEPANIRLMDFREQPLIFDFPDGQPHVKLPYGVSGLAVTIRARITSPRDLFTLLLTNEALRNAGATEVHLYCTYLMGARMDRRISELEPWTLKVVTDMLNGCKFDSITLLDPHSEVAVALLGAKVILPFNQVLSAIQKMREVSLRDPVLVAPDLGAAKRVQELASVCKCEVVQCAKHRDPATGKLSGFELYQPERVKDKHCLIVDDICDGGGTFTPIANLLREAGAQYVGLYVTHGIFSKGLPLKGIDHVWTTDSYQEQKD